MSRWGKGEETGVIQILLDVSRKEKRKEEARRYLSSLDSAQYDSDGRFCLGKWRFIYCTGFGDFFSQFLSWFLLQSCPYCSVIVDPCTTILSAGCHSLLPFNKTLPALFFKITDIGIDDSKPGNNIHCSASSYDIFLIPNFPLRCARSSLVVE